MISKNNSVFHLTFFNFMSQDMKQILIGAIDIGGAKYNCLFKKHDQKYEAD